MTDPQTTERLPAECFHPSVFILEEAAARGWTTGDLALAMGGDYRVNLIALDLYIHVGPNEPDLLIGDGEDFARAFGTDAAYWRHLEARWRKWRSGQSA